MNALRLVNLSVFLLSLSGEKVYATTGKLAA